MQDKKRRAEEEKEKERQEELRLMKKIEEDNKRIKEEQDEEKRKAQEKAEQVGKNLIKKRNKAELQCNLFKSLSSFVACAASYFVTHWCDLIVIAQRPYSITAFCTLIIIQLSKSRWRCGKTLAHHVPGDPDSIPSGC